MPFEYPDLDHLPFDEARRVAITRRVSMLMEWPVRPDYAFVSHPESTDHLKDFIKIVVDVLGAGVPSEEWAPYYEQFKRVRVHLTQMSDYEDDKIQQSSIYSDGVVMIGECLEDYLEFVKGYHF